MLVNYDHKTISKIYIRGISVRTKDKRLIVGDKVGRWKVIEIHKYYGKSSHNPPQKTTTTKLLCECECGERREISQKDLKPNRTLGCLNCYNKTKVEDLTNQRFGKIVIVSRAENKNGNTRWNCVCDCGKILVCYASHIKIRKNNGCGKCNSYGEITSINYHHLKRSAKVRKIEFDLTPKEIWDLFLKQDRKCALSGLELTLWNSEDYGTASLDRIDSTLPYRIDNCQWIHKTLNLCKHILTNNEFISMCEAVLKQNPQFERVDWQNTKERYQYLKTSKTRKKVL